MMTLDEIQREAAYEATKTDINWDALSDPIESVAMTNALDLSVRMIPDLESIYTKLTSGKSVVFPDKETSLGYNDIQTYSEVIAEELHAAYFLREIRHTITQVNNIIKLASE